MRIGFAAMAIAMITAPAVAVESRTYSPDETLRMSVVSVREISVGSYVTVRIENASDAPKSVSVSCGFYGPDSMPIGSQDFIVQMIPPGDEAIEEAPARVKNVAEVSCRIIDVRNAL